MGYEFVVFFEIFDSYEKRSTVTKVVRKNRIHPKILYKKVEVLPLLWLLSRCFAKLMIILKMWQFRLKVQKNRNGDCRSLSAKPMGILFQRKEMDIPGSSKA